MNELIHGVIEWAESKGIYAESTAEDQLLGAIGELFEFRETVIKNETPEAIATELGDVLVFLINWAKLVDPDTNAYLGMILKHLGRPEHVYNFSFRYDAVLSLSKGQVGLFCNNAIGGLLAMIPGEYTAQDCLQLAYDKILKRTKGKMQNGKFVKDGD